MSQQQQIELMQQQLDDLQSQLAFQEDTIAALDVVVSQQQQDILRLQKLIELMEQRYQLLQVSAAEEVPVEKPPHY